MEKQKLTFQYISIVLQQVQGSKSADKKSNRTVIEKIIMTEKIKSERILSLVLVTNRIVLQDYLRYNEEIAEGGKLP